MMTNGTKNEAGKFHRVASIQPSVYRYRYYLSYRSGYFICVCHMTAWEIKSASTVENIISDSINRRFLNPVEAIDKIIILFLDYITTGIK